MGPGRVPRLLRVLPRPARRLLRARRIGNLSVLCLVPAKFLNCSFLVRVQFVPVSSELLQALLGTCWEWIRAVFQVVRFLFEPYGFYGSFDAVSMALIHN